MTEREAYIALNMIEGIGPVTVAALVGALGSPQAILAADAGVLQSVRGVGPEIAERVLRQRDRVDPVREVEEASRHGASIVTRADAAYPRRLREIHDPPLALYVRGSLEGLDGPAMAVVGTRHATHYGRETAERLGYQLAQTGFLVVSGLALGIDTAAHRGALKAGGRTVAVIGSALDALYPPENSALADEVAGHGAVLSEFSMGRKPDRTTFPIRNRIVSGLSMGVVVVEAGTGSGALITSRQAAEQGRTVFAVPGRVDSPASRGPHQLLRSGARLVEGIDDVLDELQFLIPRRMTEAPAAPMPALSAEERRLADLLRDGAMDVDSLIRASGLSAAQVSACLITLEMKKVVRLLPGRQVERTRAA